MASSGALGHSIVLVLLSRNGYGDGFQLYILTAKFHRQIFFLTKKPLQVEGNGMHFLDSLCRHLLRLSMQAWPHVSPVLVMLMQDAEGAPWQQMHGSFPLPIGHQQMGHQQGPYPGHPAPWSHQPAALMQTHYSSHAPPAFAHPFPAAPMGPLGGHAMSHQYAPPPPAMHAMPPQAAPAWYPPPAAGGPAAPAYPAPPSAAAAAPYAPPPLALAAAAAAAALNKPGRLVQTSVNTMSALMLLLHRCFCSEHRHRERNCACLMIAACTCLLRMGVPVKHACLSTQQPMSMDQRFGSPFSTSAQAHGN